MIDFRFDIITEYSHFFLMGTLLTIGLSLASVFLGSLLGLFIAIGELLENKVLAFVFKAYVGFFRGTPLFVQILIIYFGVIPALFGEANGIVSAITALSLNAGAYIAETIRAGIQSISRGQAEASRSLGMNKFQSMRYIILPQAIRRILPALGNEFISLIKDSSLASTIATPELMYWAQSMNAQYYRVWESYISVALIYLILTLTANFILKHFEKKVPVK